MEARTRTIPLDAGQFTKGSFEVHEDTLCVTFDHTEPGWIYDPRNGSARRHYRFGSARTRVSAVEAIARSMMAYDAANNARDDLITRMTIQYYLMHHQADNGETIVMLQKMFADTTVRVRAKHACGVREDCCNPYHRMLAAKRPVKSRTYKRFLAVLKRNKGLLTDPRGEFIIGCSRKEFEECVQTYVDIIADDNEL